MCGNRTAESRLLVNLGVHDQMRGDYEAALERYEKALILARENGNRTVECTTLMNIGEAYMAIGNYEAAKRNWKWCLKILTTRPHSFMQFSAHTKLALAYARQGKFDEARNTMRKDGATPDQGNMFEYIKSLAQHAEIEHLAGETEAARDILRRVESLCDEHGFGAKSEPRMFYVEVQALIERA